MNRIFHHISKAPTFLATQYKNLYTPSFMYQSRVLKSNPTFQTSPLRYFSSSTIPKGRLQYDPRASLNSALSAPGHFQLVDEENGFGIQDVLNYLKTQKISKCVVFDVTSTVVYTDYIIMLTCPSTRAMQTLSMRLVKLARSVENKHKHLVGGGDDPDGLWNIIELGAITVHLMTEEGRSSAVCQRVERRLMQNATLIPVSQWSTLKDSWVRSQERLEQNPPPQINGVVPPGYYTIGNEKAIPMDMEVVSDPEDDEFDYLHVEDDHEAKIRQLEKEALYPGASGSGDYATNQSGVIDIYTPENVSMQTKLFLENNILNDSESDIDDVDIDARDFEDDQLSDELSDDNFSDSELSES